MNPYRTIFALTLALLAGNATAESLSTAHSGLLPVPANRIVGLWQAQATIGPCLGGPTRTFIALNTFHAGGTMSDINAAPPTTRVSGQGIWRYQGRGQYKTRFQFFSYLPDGTYDGVRDITTTAMLNAHANQYSATVYARNLNPDGTLRVELCGNAIGKRVTLD